MRPIHTCFIIPEYMNKKIYDNGSQKQKRKAWKNLITTEQLRGKREVTIILPQYRRRSARLHRTIYDAENDEKLPGLITRSEGQMRDRGGQTVTEAWNYSGVTYDFFNKIFHRNSIDDNGMDLDSTVHFGEDYNNAFWSGTQMVYGDGDGDIFERFTKCIDVVGHELTHGITQYEAALEYNSQPGAINESISDVFGSLIKQFFKKQTVDKADWLIGDGLFTGRVKGEAIRSMKDPGNAYDDPIVGKDPQKDHITEYDPTESDNHGVHINSGIPNKAFYLTAMEIGGRAWEKAGRIWYITLRDRLREQSNFQTFANLTFEVAGTIYGKKSTEQKAVAIGWKGVGLIPK